MESPRDGVMMAPGRSPGRLLRIARGPWHLARRVVHFARWRWRFAQFGWRSTLRSPLVLTGTQRIRIGRNVQIWPGARIEAVGPGGAPAIGIGDDTSIQLHFHVGAALSVEIGQNVLIAGNVYITDHDHELPRPGVRRGRGLRVLPTRIDDDCWLGEGVRVLKGVHLGRGCVVGANAVVTKSFPPYSVIGGVPARMLRSLGAVPQDSAPPSR